MVERFEGFERKVLKFLKKRDTERQLPPVSLLSSLADRIEDAEQIKNIAPAYNTGRIANDATEEWLKAVLSLKPRNKSEVNRILNSLVRSKQLETVGDLRRMPFSKVRIMAFMGDRRAKFIKDLFRGGQDSQILHLS